MRFGLVSFLVFCLLLVNAQNHNLPKDLSQKTLLTIQNKPISVDDFWYVFTKNLNDEKAINTDELKEYFTLFQNFKLKVEAAKDAGLDKTPEFEKEFEGYKNQLSENYLTDKKVTQFLLKEAYDRSQEEIKASHILIRVANFDMPSDTLKAYKKIQEIRKRALAGEDFEKLAVELSEDPSAKQNKGSLGYFSALQMVYPFENAAYNTPIGFISNIIRTRFGYHILKVFDRKPILGSIHVAHIMVVKPNPDDDKDSVVFNQKKAKINEIYSKLINKEASFEELAKSYSEHGKSARVGGELPWFSGNQYDEKFVNVAYSLLKNDSVSKPFETVYGWHIVKRLDYKEPADLESSSRILLQKIERNDRAELSKDAVLQRIKLENNFKDFPKNFEIFYSIVDSTLLQGKWKVSSKAKLNKNLFTVNKSKYKQIDFANYLEKYQNEKKGGNHLEVLQYHYQKWMEDILWDIEKSKLEVKYPQYSKLLQEYKEGIILFDLTEQKVWKKAMNDTVELKEFYEKNKEKYTWDTRVEGEIYTSTDGNIALKVKKMLEKGKDVTEIQNTINLNSQLNVMVEKGLFARDQRQELNNYDFKLGVSDVFVEDGKFYVVKAVKILPHMPKEFNEVKGLITAAYQDKLMENWLDELRENYTININQNVFNELLNFVSKQK
jgi:peptidyl-prolyl cis-trans isomerase SurA